MRSIERQQQLWSLTIPPELESAFDLTAPLERGPAPAALTGAWAAIEALLIGPGDSGKHIAAERIAKIVGCAVVRAEATALAWAHRRASTDNLSAAIARASTNKERSKLLIHAASSGAQLALPRSEDQHALSRLQPLLVDSHTYVVRTIHCLETTFAGLYRQRNLLSHAGGTAGVAVRSTLTRAAPLVGAGMDRIADAVLGEGISALELAARAQVRLEDLRGKAPVVAADLLG